MRSFSTIEASMLPDTVAILPRQKLGGRIFFLSIARGLKESGMRFRGRWAGFFVVLALIGCAKDETRKTYPVKGTLTIDGQPAEAGILVYLHPQYKEQDKYPIHPKGETDASGQFQIMTYNANDGAPEGSYLITVEYPQRMGLSPHFGGDLFNGAFSNQDVNKTKPEFQVTVTPQGVTLNLDLKLTPAQRSAFEAAKKKAASSLQQGGFNLRGN